MSNIINSWIKEQILLLQTKFFERLSIIDIDRYIKKREGIQLYIIII
jgi:hypothetical protein